MAISEGESIRLDLSPTYTGAACLIIRKLDYSISLNVVKACDLSVRGGLTAKDIVDLLQSVHYDRYRFSDGGQGCRFWVDSVLMLFQDHQITTVENEVQDAREALQSVWGAEGQLEPALVTFIELNQELSGGMVWELFKF